MISYEAIRFNVHRVCIEARAVEDIRKAFSDRQRQEQHIERANGRLEALRQMTGEGFHAVFARAFYAARDTTPFAMPRPVRVTP